MAAVELQAMTFGSLDRDGAGYEAKEKEGTSSDNGADA